MEKSESLDYQIQRTIYFFFQIHCFSAKLMLGLCFLALCWHIPTVLWKSMCCAIGGGGPPFFKLTIFKLHLQKKCVSITLMHCISISPVYGYNVNVLPNAAHPVVDSVSKNFEVDYRNRPICTRVAGSIGDRSLVSPASTAIPQRGGPSSWAVAAFPPSALSHVYLCADSRAASSLLLM